MKILRFEEYSINESLTEFGFNHISATGVAGSGVAGDTTQPNDPKLTTDGFDRFMNNVHNAQNRLMDILSSVFAAPGNIKMADEDEVAFEKFKINRMYRNNAGGVDIYCEYVVDKDPENIYYGVFRNWGSNYPPKFESKILEGKSKMFNTKFIGKVKSSLQKWFKPENVEYKNLMNEVSVWDEMGNKHIIKKGEKIKVEHVQIQHFKPIIYLEHKKNIYQIRDLDFYYFNWWFEPVKKRKLKI